MSIELKAANRQTKETRPCLNADATRQYTAAGFALIPLYPFNHTSERKGIKRKDGKRPVHFDWTVRKYDSAAVLKEAIKRNRNVGVRLTASQLVIDVDPRNGGTEGFDNLCLDLGLDPLAFPCVITGSGGFHFYMSKPETVPILDTLKDYPGVEFKSKGRQVVAAGSIHPDTKRFYKWSKDHTSIKTLPNVPEQLLNIIRRPQRSAALTGGGQASQEDIARALDSLDVTEFREHDKWLRLMMACHHASNGDARHEFLEWSTSDARYEQDAELIGRRWDSLHREKNDGVSYKTLNHFLREEGDTNFQIAADASDDFDAVSESPSDDDSWLDGEPVEVGPLESLNSKYCAVFNAAHYRIMYREAHAGGMRWSACSKADFLARFENRRIESGDRAIPLGKAWQEWPHRKTADGTCFDTRSAPAALVDGSLNLWSGFAIEPKPGSCELFKRMILEDLCAGNQKVSDYILKWIAWKVQHPGDLPEVAVALVGAKGTGKTTLGNTVKRIFGEHGMIARDVSQFAGRFNGHLETKCFLYGDESFWGGDRANESALKQLITDSEVSYEYKGLQIHTGRNHVGLMFAGNENWIVPASIDERRFCVTQVSTRHVAPDNASKDHPNRAYWNALHRELDNGGRAAFLHEMLNLDLAGWHPRIGVPRTAALGEQKAHGLKGVLRWYMDQLKTGQLEEVELIDNKAGDWTADNVHVSPTSITAAYAGWLQYRNPHAIVTNRTVINELRAFGWLKGRMPNKKRDRYYLVPRLDDARRLFAEKIGYDPFKS